MPFGRIRVMRQLLPKSKEEDICQEK